MTGEMTSFQAAVAVLHEGENLLMIKRKVREGDPWSGDVAFPGGFRKDGESGEETAARECEEETGIRPGRMVSIGPFRTHLSGLTVMAYFGSTDMLEPVAGDEVDSAFWVPVSELVETGSRYLWNGLNIWGLTYRILGTILSERERFLNAKA